MRTKTHNFNSVLKTASIFILAFVAALFFVLIPDTFADDDSSESGIDLSTGAHYVTIYDHGDKKTVKSDAVTVAEVLDRANIEITDGDIVDPALDSIITEDTYNINIYRAHPVVMIDGSKKQYIMTASYDPKAIAESAGITVYDGDEIERIDNTANFMESGATATYRLTRNGGRTITVEESIPYTEETVADPSMNTGETKVTQVGEDGRKTYTYQVNFVDGKEVSRELVSEVVTKQPVKQIIAQGAKTSVAPGQETCAQWVRQAGVSEADLSAALYLIYHESGCRVDATNKSSGAYGIPQALPGKKMASAGSDWQTNPITQIKWMAGYVKGRYGGWQQALAYWNTHHNY